MSDNETGDSDGGAAPGKGRMADYRNVVSLGNILILVGMMGTGGLGIYTVGGSVQKLQDAIEHEVVVRQDGQKNLQDQFSNYQQTVNQQIASQQQIWAHDLASLQQQEVNDIRSLNTTLGDVRTDLRTLMQRWLDQGAVQPQVSGGQRRG